MGRDRNGPHRHPRPVRSRGPASRLWVARAAGLGEDRALAARRERMARLGTDDSPARWQTASRFPWQKDIFVNHHNKQSQLAQATVPNISIFSGSACSMDRGSSHVLRADAALRARATSRHQAVAFSSDFSKTKRREGPWV